MEAFIESLFTLFPALNYTAIFVLMAMESSIIPVPSELVMIPAGVLVARGTLDPIFAVLAGGIGSVVGALLNYWILGRLLGKSFLEKYGKYFLITAEKYQRAENLFLKNDRLYTFIGRFLPVIRHLISIPAGIFKMRMLPFLSLTFIGSTIWCAFLLWFGYAFGETGIALMTSYTHEIGLLAIPLVLFFVWWKVFKKESH
ncbi:MAG: DedA family protein [Candidatus Peregrinibacteria bacterium]